MIVLSAICTAALADLYMIDPAQPAQEADVYAGGAVLAQPVSGWGGLETETEEVVRAATWPVA